MLTKPGRFDLSLKTRLLACGATVALATACAFAAPAFAQTTTTQATTTTAAAPSDDQTIVVTGIRHGIQLSLIHI